MLDSVGHKTVICGPESFTPDSMPLFGETPEVGNFSELAKLFTPWKDIFMQV